jgi:hypothetical protein
VHTDSWAARAAHGLGAYAFTLGQHIVFNRREYRPQTEAGRHLLAHELAHTIQQDASPTDPTTSISRMGTNKRPALEIIQRKLEVDPNAEVPLPPGQIGPPTPLTHAVQGLMEAICPDGGFQVNPTTGRATSTAPAFCVWPQLVDQSSTPAGCSCLCDVVRHPQTTTVEFRSRAGPAVTPGSTPGTGSAPGQAGQSADPTVHMDPRFQGQYRIGGRWVDVPFHLLFAHEVCGHALPKMRGTHVARGPRPRGGTAPQERAAVDVERAIAAEQGLPRRPEDYAGGARQRP